MRNSNSRTYNPSRLEFEQDQKFLSKMVEEKGWRLVEWTEHHVLVERDYSPFGGKFRFATLAYSQTGNGLFWGHYDLSLSEAVRSLADRTEEARKHG
mgnify:FL=1